MSLFNIRASSLNHVADCRAYVAMNEEIAADIPPDISNDASVLGTAYHMLAAAFVESKGKWTEETTKKNLQDAAAYHSVPFGDLQWLWKRLAFDPDAGSPLHLAAEAAYAEVLIEDVLTLSGTCDVERWFAVGPPAEGAKTIAIDIIDWKTGRLAIEEEPDAWAHWQGLAYLCMAAREARRSGYDVVRGRVIIYPVRLGDQPTIFSLDADGLEKAWARVRALALEAHGQRTLDELQRSYRVGYACTWCDAKRTCKAYRKDMQSALALVVDGTELEVTADNAEKVFDLRRLAGKLEKGLDTALKEHVKFFGPLAVSGGRELRFNDYRATPSLNVGHVKDVIDEMRALGDIRMADEKRDLLVELLGKDQREKVDRQRFGRFKLKAIE